MGTVLLIAGLVFGSIGAYRISTNLPIPDEEVLAEARTAVLSGTGARRARGANPFEET